jgi:putative oxidoreductase
MNNTVSRYAPYAFALLRIVVGLLFAMHGSQKLLGFPGDKPAMGLAGMMGVAGIIELVGGLLIALGLLTRPAAFLCSGLMAVAYFMAHAPNGALPIVNQGELAVVYCFVFLYIWAHGPGIWSLDGLVRRNDPAVVS